MTIYDPVVGRTSTKVGETTYSSPSQQRTYHTPYHDPIIGRTSTKVGETVNTISSGYSNYPYHMDYHYVNTFPRTYRRVYPSYTNRLCNLVVYGAIAIGIIAILASPSSAHRAPSLPYRGNRYDNFGYTSFWNSYGKVWKCDIMRECDQLLSGRKVNCIDVERNCGWRWS